MCARARDSLAVRGSVVAEYDVAHLPHTAMLMRRITQDGELLDD